MHQVGYITLWKEKCSGNLLVIRDLECKKKNYLWDLKYGIVAE